VQFRCWIKGEKEDFGCTIEAADPRDAASDACEKWESGGSWAGDPIPDPVEVYVRAVETRELYMVKVSHDWSVDFHAARPVPAAEPS